MGAAYVGTAEADMLQSVQKDPESMAAAKAYMKAVMKEKNK